MTNKTEAEILAEYSTPGMKTGELTREQKKRHLASLGIKGVEAEERLDKIFGSNTKLDGSNTNGVD